MFSVQEALNRVHLISDIYWRGSERKRRRLVVVETEERMGRVFSAYGKPLTEVPSFNYLGQTSSSSNNYWPVVEQNIRREKGKWGQPVKILGRDGEDRRTAGRFYVAVVQAVILFGSETWVMNPWMEKAIEGFHLRAI